MTAIKKNIRNLSINDLKRKKEEIVNFILSFPKNTRKDQGWMTIGVIEELIEAMQAEDQFKVLVIKELFFED